MERAQPGRGGVVVASADGGELVAAVRSSRNNQQEAKAACRARPKWRPSSLPSTPAAAVGDDVVLNEL